MSIRKLFDRKPEKVIRSRKLKHVKTPKKYREVYRDAPMDELNNPNRYRYTYDDLKTFSDDKVEWISKNGFPEERDDARDVIAKRKMKNLANYGY